MLRHALALVLLSMFAIACTPHPLFTSQASCEDHPLYVELIEAEESMIRVIVTLAHEPGTDVAQTQDELLSALEATEFELVRRFENFPMLTLDVGEAAFCRLVGSPLVVGIQRDEAVPPAAL